MPCSTLLTSTDQCYAKLMKTGTRDYYKPIAYSRHFRFTAYLRVWFHAMQFLYRGTRGLIPLFLNLPATIVIVHLPSTCRSWACATIPMIRAHLPMQISISTIEVVQKERGKSSCNQVQPAQIKSPPRDVWGTGGGKGKGVTARRPKLS